MFRRAFPATGVVVLMLLGVVACGSSSDVDKITQLIKAYGKDPRTLCTTYATPSMLRLQFQTRSNCLTAASSPGAADPRVKVDSVSVSGTSATAIRTTGTPPSVGSKSKIYLVKQNGDWKVSLVAPG